MLKFSLSLVVLALASPSARADPIRLQIVGPDKKPVAGARVRVVEFNGLQPDKTAVALDFVSDAQGKVAFESKKPFPPLDTKPLAANISTRYALCARVLAPGLVVAAQTLRAGDNQISLDAGASFGGAVFDEEQRPVAGVTIVASGLSGTTRIPYYYLQGALRLETVSDAAGKWSFDSLPREGTMEVEVVSPRFVRESARVTLGTAGMPLYLERGASIKGRLLRPDGQPAAGIALGSGGRFSISSDGEVVTAPDGTFELSGLRAGNLSVQHASLRSREVLPFLVSEQQVKALKAGEIRDIGDWKTEVGVLATGKIIESGTKKPVVDASIYIFDNGSFNAQTDENGTFTLRVAREVETGHISARGFVPFHKTLPKAVGERLEIGTIEIKRGLVVKGILKDKEGRVLARRQLYAQNADGARAYGFTDEKGEWTLDGLQAGTYTLKLEGAKLVGEVPIVAAEGKSAPVVAIAEAEAQAEKDAPRKLVGVALDSAGKPVAGVKVILKATRDNGAQTINAVSGADGRFEGETFMAGAVPTLVSAVRPGLLLAGGGDFKVVDGVWQTELRFQPRGQITRGRVVNSEGKPIPRVWVGVPGSGLARASGDLPIALTDELGAFALVDAASAGGLVVSDGRSYGLVVPDAGGDVTMPAAKSPDYDGAALALQILPDANLGLYSSIEWDDLWALAGDERLETALLRSISAEGLASWTWNEYLRQMSRRAPKMFMARGDELLAQSPEPDARTAAMLARFRGRSDDPLQRQKAADWLEIQAKKQLGITAESVTQLLRIASVAHALKAGDGARWIEFAAQIEAQLSDKARSAGALEWGQLAATIDEPTLNNFIVKWGDKAKFNALRGAVITLRRAGDLPAARAMLLRVEAMQSAAEGAKAEVRYETEYSVEKPAVLVAQSRAEVAELLALTDPQAAWELSKTATASSSRQSILLLAIAQNAVRLDQFSLAAQALRAVSLVPPISAASSAKAAHIALKFDPKLAQELLAAMREAIKAPVEEFRAAPTIAHYAGAKATVSPGESRILLEREWASRIKTYKAPAEETHYDNSAEPLQVLIGAMARLDARRALEMVEQMPDKGSGRALARGKIVMALLKG